MERKRLAIVIKSYSPDINRVRQLIVSIEKFNKDRIPVYVLVPSNAIEYFKDQIGTPQPFSLEILDENTIVPEKYKSHLQEGWFYQQVVKLCVYNLDVALNYLVIDSDSYFIRDFDHTDFLAQDGGVPFTVMHQQKQLFEEVPLFNLPFDPKISYEADRKRIKQYLRDTTHGIWDFGPTPVIWNSFVLSRLNDDNIIKLLEVVPSELTWYGQYAKKYLPSLYPIEPLFKVFHYKQQYEIAKQVGFTEEHYKKNYLGIVMQSNWGAPLAYDKPLINLN